MPHILQSLLARILRPSAVPTAAEMRERIREDNIRNLKRFHFNNTQRSHSHAN